MQRWRGWAAVAGALGLVSAPAQAGENDLALSLLGSPRELKDGDTVVVALDPDAQERFARFVMDFAMAVTPLPAGQAGSMGDAGFSLSLSADVAVINPQQKLLSGGSRLVWPTERTLSDASKGPAPAFLVPTLHLRKGLPFGFEVGGSFGFIPLSQMITTSGHVKWALFEGVQYVPDISVQALVTSVLGTGPLSLVVGGWDAGATEKFSIGGGSELAISGGFQKLGVNAETGNVDFSAAENTDRPYADDGGFAAMPLLADKNQPLASILNPVTSFSRFYFGLEWRRQLLTLGLDGAYAWGENGISGEAAAPRFASSQWRVAGRLGITF